MAAQYNTGGDCQECGAKDGRECQPGCLNHPDSHYWEGDPEAAEESAHSGW